MSIVSQKKMRGQMGRNGSVRTRQELAFKALFI